jgi:hypothetical protein
LLVSTATLCLWLPRFLSIPTLLLLSLLRGLPSGGGWRFAPCGARRIIAKTPVLAGGERLRRLHAIGRADDVLRLPHPHLRAEIRAKILVAQILGPHLPCAGNPCRPCDDQRVHLKGAYRPPANGGNDGRRNPRVNRKHWPVVVDHHGAVHDHGLLDENIVLSDRQDHGNDPRRDEVPPAHENPNVGLVAILYDNVVGR